MKNKSFPLVIMMIAVLLLGMIIVPENPLYDINWALASAIIIGLVIVALFWQFDRETFNSKDITLLATMASLAAISRIPFAAIMGLQPTTFIVMITGYVFGSQMGFMVGAVAALVSNFFLGQGPWTPWQMFSWGLCGVIAGLMGNNNKLNLISFTIITGLCGFLFGWIMNLWHWAAFIYPLDWTTFLAAYMLSFPADTIHAVGNIAFSVMFGKSFFSILNRFKKKLIVKYTEFPS